MTMRSKPQFFRQRFFRFVLLSQIILFLLQSNSSITLASAFTSSALCSRTRPSSLPKVQLKPLFSTSRQEELVQQAQDLLAKAQRLREEIGEIDSRSTTNSTTTNTNTTEENNDTKSETTTTTQSLRSEWSVEASPTASAAGQTQTYRLYIDIGREDGSWMEPRWGASGRRMEGTLDVSFSTTLASREIVDSMVQDNQKGKSSEIFVVETGIKARLKGGFDSMKVEPGGYRIDNGGTIRFYVSVEGSQDGDVSIPQGNLYFSLPCFFRGGSTTKRTGEAFENVLLSTKEGIVSVRQIGWHTGWRRQESRIVGVFRAVPIEKAQRVDRY
jgi:hypothetical protein